MQLPHRPRLNRKQRHREIRRDGETLRIQDLDAAAGDLIRLLLAEVVGICVFIGNAARGTRDVLLGDVGGRGRPGEDVQLAFRNIVESAGVDLQVFGEDGFGVSLEELGDQERAVFAELAVVEDEEELDAVAEGLDVVGHAGGEEPDVALLQVVDEGAAGFVDGGDAHGAVEDETPFVGLVPVEFAVGVGLEVHVDASEGCGDWEVVDVLLASPAGALETMAIMGEGCQYV